MREASSWPRREGAPEGEALRSPLTDSLPREVTRRFGAAVGVFAVAIAAGTFGYYSLGEGRWTLFDCFYMTVVTLSTVGFAETLPGLGEVEGARLFTVSLIVLGSGTLLYFASSLTAFIIEGDLVGVLRRRRMQRKVDEMSGHVVVCGVGSTGIHCIEELVAVGTPFVAVDSDEGRLVRLADAFPETSLLYVVGDATDDQTLQRAGIERARGVIAALHDDRDNVFVTITARALNARARIVAKAVEASADKKLRRAGADAIVSPNRIGGMRLVSELIRPHVVEFLDTMLRESRRSLRIEEVPVPKGSRLDGRSLREADLRRIADVLVIAVRRADGDYEHNPSPETPLQAGMSLIVLGECPQVNRLRAWTEGREPVEACD